MNFIEGMLDATGNVVPSKWAEFQAAEIEKIEELHSTPIPLTVESTMEIIQQLEIRIAELEAGA
jgi:bifunctional DNase/RNase